MKSRKYLLLSIVLVIVFAVTIIFLIPKRETEGYNIGQISNSKLEVSHKDVIRESQTYVIDNIKSITIGNNFTTPTWSPDGQSITYTAVDQCGIMIMNKDGSNSKVLTNDIGAGYKYAWSLDNRLIAYRGTIFVNNKRIQFIGVIDVKNGTSEIISTLVNSRLQPPSWTYSDNSKQVVYVSNGKLTYSRNYPFSAKNFKKKYSLSDANRLLYYNDGNLYLIEKDSKINNEIVKGLDPVFSPDKQQFIYAKLNQLFLFSFNGDINTFIDVGCHPSWSPDGSTIVYQKTIDDGEKVTDSDLFIMDIANMKKLRLTHTKDTLEANPCWSPEGNIILFNDEKSGNLFNLTLEKFN